MLFTFINREFSLKMYFTDTESFKKWIDFNGMSTRLQLFYA